MKFGHMVVHVFFIFVKSMTSVIPCPYARHHCVFQLHFKMVLLVSVYFILRCLRVTAFLWTNFFFIIIFKYLLRNVRVVLDTLLFFVLLSVVSPLIFLTCYLLFLRLCNLTLLPVL